MSNRRNALRQWSLRATVAISAVVFFVSGVPASALSTDQVNALNEQISYFNTEDDCGGISTASTGSPSPTALSGNDNEQKAFNYFIGKGINATGTAAVVGNLMEESHLDPTIVQNPPGGDTKDPSWITASAYPLTGYGIAQWTPGAKVIGIAQSLKITGPISDLSTQLDIVWAEMTGSAPTGFQNVAAGLNKQANLSDATSYFQVNFESGTNFSARYTLAQQAFQLYGASSQAGLPSPVVAPLSTISTTSSINCAAAAATTTAASGKGKNIFWLQSGPSAEFDGLCDGCRDPKSGASSYWISGQCSQASLAEILNAYQQGGALKSASWNGESLAPSTGTNYYKTIDVERLSYNTGPNRIWDGIFQFQPSMKASWQTEAKIFHMSVTFYDNNTTPKIAADETSLGNMISIANAGTPLITDGPDHWLVIWGGDAKNVWLLDSSPHDETWMPASSQDSVTVKQYPTPVGILVPRETFLKGLAGYANYWGADKFGQNPNPTVVQLIPTGK